MELARELLDNQVVDRHRAKIGKVDSVVLELPDDGPPRVVAMEIGAAILAERVHPHLRRWLEAAARQWRLRLPRTRIPWARVTGVGREVHVAIDGERIRAQALERWLRDRVIARIPGSRR